MFLIIKLQKFKKMIWRYNTQRNDTKHNDIQQKDTQKGLICLT